MSDLTFVPPTFALHGHPDDDSPVVVGWGLVLPNGTVIATGWSDGESGAIAICGSADRAGFIYNGDVVWTSPLGGDRPDDCGA